MTKKDYKLIASALQKARTQIYRNLSRMTLEEEFNEIIWHISEALSSDNPRFNRSKFEDAAGYIEFTK